jgi:hypothetical protein
VYGLDAANGATRWAVATGGAILAAPLLADGIAYLGSADGVFYAIDLIDGSLRWQAPIGVPLLGSAALGSNGEQLFVVAEDVAAYALRRSDGALLWRTQLQGQSGADRWPVVLGDSVFFRTMPPRFFHTVLQEADHALDRAGPLQADWQADWRAVRPQIEAHLTEYPYDQTFFALDAASGASRGLAPLLYTFGNNEPPAPPVVYNHQLYLPYRARHGIQNDSPAAVHVTTRYDAEPGRMDPQTLEIAGLRSPDTFAYQFRLTSDEAGVFSLAGDLLLIDNWERLGGIDLASGRLVGIAQVGHEFPECYTACEANDDLLPFYDSHPFAGPQVGEGHPRTGAVVAAGRIFWRVQESGLAALGPATEAAQQPPAPALNRLVATSGPSAELPPPITPTLAALRDYVWREPVVTANPHPALQAQLRAEVARIVVSDTHLLPLYIERGFHGQGSWPPTTTNPPEPANLQQGHLYWYDPGELVLSLALAYPYLDAELQARVAAYLATALERYPPLQPLPYSPQSWIWQGRARELHTVPLRDSWNAWPPPAPPIQTLYALWAYAQATGDWAYLATHWNEMDALFARERDAIDSYAEIAGAIGYARIAARLGKAEAAAAAGEAVAVAAMQRGLAFDAWRERANQLYPDPRDVRTGQRGQVFFGLTPEVGRYLYDTNRAAVEQTLDATIGYPHGSYLWYATRVGVQAELGESSYQTPELGWSAYLAQAYILQAKQHQLIYWLDRPWALGDVWHLQKLVAALAAPVQPERKLQMVPWLQSVQAAL